MAIIGTIPRRCVNLPPGSLLTLLGRVATGRVREGKDVDGFYRELEAFLDVKHAFGAATGRSAFQLALEALDLPKGKEIIFPAFTFPVMPMVAKLLGYVPVFCDVDPETYNSGPKEIEGKINENTGAVLATHLFGRPCPIEETALLCQAKGIRLLEDCAHAIGVRVGGKQVGTFGDVGIFSFAQGKNMPCFGGGAIATNSDSIAARARVILEDATLPSTKKLASTGFSVWMKWLLTRPLVFGLSGYQALKLKLMLGKPLMDSRTGDDLIADFEASSPKTVRFGNLQGAIGRKQLKHIDRFNAGARRNAEILTEGLEGVTGIRAPSMEGEHIYVYYPLGVDADVRDDLRHHLLRDGVDTKRTDMSDCSALKAFDTGARAKAGDEPAEASLLEICVYPTLSEKQMRRIAKSIRTWAATRSD